MTIVGCDFHPAWQQIAVLDTETGEITEQKLMHGMERQSGFTSACQLPHWLGWRPAATANGSSICCGDWAMKSGSGMRPRSAPAMFASKKPTGVMPGTF